MSTAHSSRRPARVVTTVLLAAGLFGTAACERIESGSISMLLSEEIGRRTRWVEVSAFRNLKCSIAGRTAYGEAPVNGPSKRLLFTPSEVEGRPEFGDLEPGYYAFVAQAKDDFCAVIARGCVGVDLRKSGNVQLTLQAEDIAGPACKPGMSCELGQCVPTQAGTNCSLDVSGSSALFPQGAVERMWVGSPTVRPTLDGFLVAYTEEDDIASSGPRLITQPVSRSGAPRPNEMIVLEERCGGANDSSGAEPPKQSDGVGLELDGDQQKALLAVSRNGCDAETPNGLDLVLLRATQAAPPSTAIEYLRETEPNPVDIGDGQLVRLGKGHAVASLGSGEWVVAALLDDEPRLVFVSEDGGRVVASPNASSKLFGEAGMIHDDAGVIASPDFVVAYSVQAGEPPKREPPEPGSGVLKPAPEARGKLLVQAASTSNVRANGGVLPAPLELVSHFGSAALLGSRVYVVSSALLTDHAVVNAYDLDASAPGGLRLVHESVEFMFAQELGEGLVEHADITAQGEYVYVLTAGPGEAVLSVLHEGNDGLVPIRSVRLSQVRASSLASISGGRVSIAATPTRVLASWVNGMQLREDQPLGGYVEFACRP